MAQEFSFRLEFEDFDRSLLGTEPPAVGSDEFKSLIEVFFVEQFAGFGGTARVIMDDVNRMVEVRWTKEKSWKDPQQKALDFLNAGQFKHALPILTTLYHKNPADVDTLYRLGLTYSELGEFHQAVELLEKAVERAPEHVHAIVALGVAEIASGNLLIAEEWLRKALQLEPGDRWALRNLAGTLMKQRRFDESLAVVQKCLAVAPDDLAMMIAYGDCLAELGRGAESETHYRMATKVGGDEHLVDLAKARLSDRSEKAFRSAGDVRPEVVEYIRDAMQRFKSMDVAQIQNFALELALIGNKGLNINDPAKKHQLTTWPGEYSGLEVISIMYAAFQQFAPGTDLGIDLRREYRIATQPGP
jgi:tetratricopeptide (TPR) repeat protein